LKSLLQSMHFIFLSCILYHAPNDQMITKEVFQVLFFRYIRRMTGRTFNMIYW
jgi:hypothetical protein